MKITPLVLHAFVHIPRYTAAFSTALPVSNIVVTAGGNTVLNCSAPHGVPVGSSIGVSIVDAESPNSIAAASVLASGDILLTTAHDHDLTTSPDTYRFQAWNTVCKLSGFADSKINGTRQLVEVRSRRQIVIKPGGEVGSVSLTGSEILLERIELGLIGWHAVTATSTTALRFTTPAVVDRSYTIATPVVVNDVKIFGARDPEAAYKQYTQGDDKIAPTHGAMFICPEQGVVAERATSARGQTVAEFGPGIEYRQRLADGFQVVIFLPSVRTSAHVACIDMAQGEVFTAVLRTFNGLRLPRPELFDGGTYASVFHGHGSGSVTNNAVYAHRYDFQSPAYLTNADAIAPWDWTESGDGGTGPITDVVPIGTPPLRDLDFTGILHDGKPQPLFGKFKVNQS